MSRKTKLVPMRQSHYEALEDICLAGLPIPCEILEELEHLMRLYDQNESQDLLKNLDPRFYSIPTKPEDPKEHLLIHTEYFG